jgi:ABC-type transport system involved in multi-copper enzyme maturation permease subunit
MKSKLKYGFYILVGIACLYVFLMISSLDPTVREGATANDPATKNQIDKQIENMSKETELDNKLYNMDKLDNTTYTTETYTSIVWAILATMLLFLIFTEL